VRVKLFRLSFTECSRAERASFRPLTRFWPECWLREWVLSKFWFHLALDSDPKLVKRGSELVAEFFFGR
jgi:hypothetical protein